MMKNYDESIEINQNTNWPYILYHIYRILIIDDSGSGKTNLLLKLININQQILTEIVYMVKIHLNQSIHFSLTEEKK